jgi:hypothetical protein
MNDVSRRSWSAAVGVTVGVAVALAGPAFSGAATPAKPKPLPAGAQAKAPPPPGAAEGKAGTGKGIVQSVSAQAIVLRELDGSTVRIPVASSTHVFVDGKRAALRDVKAGFVASAAWRAGKPARVLHAFDLSGPNAVRVGIVDSVSARSLVVSGTGGAPVSILVDAKTRVFIDGKRAALAAVKPGYTVVLLAKDSRRGKPARELRFLRPG